MSETLACRIVSWWLNQQTVVSLRHLTYIFLTFVIENYPKGSSVASRGKGGRVPPLTAKKNAKNRGKEGEKREKIGKRGGKSGKREKIGKQRQKSGRFFHFAPPDREGWLYATAQRPTRSHVFQHIEGRWILIRQRNQISVGLIFYGTKGEISQVLKTR